MGNSDPRELMAAIRERLARRLGEPVGGALGLGTTDARPHGVNPTLPVIAPIVLRDHYALSELLAYPDRLFVENAYRAVLRREPDPVGLNAHLEALRRGDVTKVGLLGLLVASEEAKALAVRIDGLSRPLKLERWRRKRGVGRVVGWLFAALRLDEQARRAALVANWHEQLIVTSLEHGNRAVEAQALMEARLDSVRGQVVQLRNDIQHEVAGVSDAIGQLTRQLETHAEARLDSVRGQIVQLRNDIQHEVAGLSDVIEQLKSQMELHAQAEQEAFERHEALVTRVDELAPARDAGTTALDGMYVEFERRFRGDPELIRARMQPHLAWIQEAAAGTRQRPVIDIGCGAGDWLDLLRAEHCVARGIDTNRIFVELCRGRGLDVNLGDGIEVLRDLPDNTCGALTSIHVVEHLPFESLIALLDEALRVLAPGGVLILETPNPENLAVATLGFYMDPTHRNPLPPEMLRWVVEARGFSDSRIERLTAARELALPAFLSPDIPGSGSVNALISHFAEAPDYAIVARKLP